jgi:hypothetical protein
MKKGREPSGGEMQLAERKRAEKALLRKEEELNKAY